MSSTEWRLHSAFQHLSNDHHQSSLSHSQRAKYRTEAFAWLRHVLAEIPVDLWAQALAILATAADATYRRGFLLDISGTLMCTEKVAIILKVLPDCCCVDNDDTEERNADIMDCLTHLLDRFPTLLAQFLACWRHCELPKDAALDIFMSKQQLLTNETLSLEELLPQLLPLLNQDRVAVDVVDEKRTIRIWHWIRVRTYEKDDVLPLLEIVVRQLRQSGVALVTSYLKSTQQIRQEGPEAFELIILLVLANDYEDAVDDLLYDWIDKETLPFNKLQLFLEETKNTCLFQFVQPNLSRFAFFLLMVTFRVNVTAATMDQIQQMVVFTFDMLQGDTQTRDELVLGLFALLEQVRVAPDPHEGSRKRKRTHTTLEQTSSAIATKSVCAILRSLSETSPASMGILETSLREMLESQEQLLTLEMTNDLCRMLVACHMYRGSMSESLAFLRKLLFTVSDNKHSAVCKGLVFARTLTNVESLNRSQSEKIHGWVARVFLPPSRKAVPPVWGEAAVHFLQSVLANPLLASASSKVFEETKIALSNTGLVQLLCEYEKGLKRRGVAIGFRSSRTGDLKGGHRQILFCLRYFLRRVQNQGSEDWACTSRFVYSLIDLYLELGRKYSPKGWVPDGWIMSCLEYEPFQWPHKVDVVLEEVEASLMLLDRGAPCFQPSSNELRRALSKLTGNEEKMECVSRLRTLQLTLLLWTSMGLAVLKNAYLHFDRKILDQRQLSLLQLQLEKLYVARTKCALVQTVLSFWQAEKLSTGREAKICNYDEMIVGALLSPDYLSPGVLWTYLSCHVAEERLISIVRGHEGHTESLTEDNRQVSLQCEVLDHLETMYSQSADQVVSSPAASALEHIVRMLVILLGDTAIDQNAPEKGFIGLRASYLRLLTTLLLHSRYHGTFVAEWSRLNFDFLPKSPSTTELPASVSSLNSFLHERMLQVKCGLTVDVILETVTALAIQQETRSTMLKKVVAVSWKKTQTVFENVEANVPPSKGRLFHVLVSEVEKNSSASALSKVEYSGLSTEQQAILRHLALVGTSATFFIECHQQLSDFVLAIKNEVKTLQEVTTCEEGALTTAAKKRGLPGLNATTFPKFFELALSMLAFTLCSMDASCGSGESPFVHLILHFKLFRQLLLGVYVDHCHLFPRSFRQVLLHLCRRVLKSGMAKLENAAKWRRSQPMISSADRRLGRADAGAIGVFQELIVCFSACVVSSVGTLCDVSVEDENGSQMLFKHTRISVEVDDTRSKLDRLAGEHSLPFPSTTATNDAADSRWNNTAILPQPEAVSNLRSEGGAEDEAAATNTIDEEVVSSTSSYEVAGEWGESDEEDSCSDDENLLKTTMFLRTS